MCSSLDIDYVYRSHHPTWSPWPLQNHKKMTWIECSLTESIPVIIRADVFIGDAGHFQTQDGSIYKWSLKERVNVVLLFFSNNFTKLPVTNITSFEDLRVFIWTQLMILKSSVRLWLEVILNTSSLLLQWSDKYLHSSQFTMPTAEDQFRVRKLPGCILDAQILCLIDVYMIVI